ncbi:hypothetical protein TZ02_18880 [Clostridium aceticum]|nr:hypothetical protein TZ02_18880 [Clostridium aceticum]
MGKFKEIYDGYMLVLVVFAGTFLLLRDVPLLRKKKLIRDMKIAKVLGYTYIVGGIALFIIAKMYRG